MCFPSPLEYQLILTCVHLFLRILLKEPVTIIKLLLFRSKLTLLLSAVRGKSWPVWPLEGDSEARGGRKDSFLLFASCSCEVTPAMLCHPGSSSSSYSRSSFSYSCRTSFMVSHSETPAPAEKHSFPQRCSETPAAPDLKF